MNENRITVVTSVYNEEARIENFLQCFVWCDDLVVVVKKSTDRTREIVQRYTDNIIDVPYSENGAEFIQGIDSAKHEWVLFVTASDIIHPGLVDKLQDLTRRDPFPFDIIAVPYVVNVLGIHSTHSPWYTSRKKSLFRKTVFSPSHLVHREISFSSNRVFKMRPNSTEALFHLTHPTVDFFFSRSIQYCHAEPKKFSTRRSGLWKTFSEIILAIGWLVVYKRVFMLGWNGIALSLAFLVYYSTKFLYVWEKFHGDPGYSDLKQKLINEWEKRGPPPQ